MRPPESAAAFGQQATILLEEVPSLLGGSWVSPPPARISAPPGLGSVCFRPILVAALEGDPASAELSLRIPQRSAPLEVRRDFGGTPPTAPRAWAAPPRPLPLCAEIQHRAPSSVPRRGLNDRLRSATSGLKPTAASSLRPRPSSLNSTHRLWPFTPSIRGVDVTRRGRRC